MTERIIAFIDGSNLLRAVGEAIDVEINSVKPTTDEMNLAFMVLNSLWQRLSSEAQTGSHGARLLRRYWFGSYQGSEEVEYQRKLQLRQNNYEPVLFRKLAQKGKEKRVDIAIAREMLLNSFRGNCDFAYLVAGDEDYLDLVEDVKKLGVRVTGCFFDKPTSKSLRLACDHFHELGIWGNGHKELVAKIKAASA